QGRARRAPGDRDESADQVRTEHRTTRRGAFPGRRICPLPPLRTQLHAAGHRERPPPRPPLSGPLTLQGRRDSNPRPTVLEALAFRLVLTFWADARQSARQHARQLEGTRTSHTHL